MLFISLITFSNVKIMFITMNDILQCRLCAEFKRLHELIHINQEESLEMNLEHKIRECLNLNFSDSLLSKYICLTCCDKVSSSFEFHELVKQAQILLQNSLTANVKDKFDTDNRLTDAVQNFSDRDDLIIKEERSDDNVDNISLSKLKSISRRTIREADSNIDPDKIINRNERSEIIRRIKNGERDSACEQCGKRFSTVSNLRYHTKTAHCEEKPYCCPHCQKTFKVKLLLKRHLQQVHSGEKPHACEICGKRFHRSGQLKEHLKVHSDTLEFECSYCKKQFKNVYRLKIHIRQHTGERPYTCVQCNHSFTDSSNYGKHMRGKKHGVLTTRKEAT